MKWTLKDKLRIVGITTSPRSEANTEALIERALEGAAEFSSALDYEIDDTLVSFAGKQILPCRNCDACVKKGSYCVLDDDWLDLIGHLIDPIPDGIVFGSPVYFFNQNSMARAFMERCTSLLKKIWHEDFPHPPPDFSTTAAGAVGVGSDRHGGVEQTISTIIHWLLTMGFNTVGGFYIGGAGWTKESAETDAISQDSLGLKSAELVGKKVAKSALLLKEGSSHLDLEGTEQLDFRALNHEFGSEV